MSHDAAFLLGKGLGYFFLFVIIPLWAYYATKGWVTVFCFLVRNMFSGTPKDPITKKPVKPVKLPGPQRTRRSKRDYPVTTDYDPIHKITHPFELES